MRSAANFLSKFSNGVQLLCEIQIFRIAVDKHVKFYSWSDSRFPIRTGVAAAHSPLLVLFHEEIAREFPLVCLSKNTNRIKKRNQ